MRALALSILIALHFSIWDSGCTTSSKVHSPNLAKLKEKYPHSILGDDHGLLIEDDILTTSCVAGPEPFSQTEFTTHPYWQCFSLRGSAFECKEDDEEPDPENRFTILAIVLKEKGAIHEYLSRRAISVEFCKAYASEWVRLTSGQEHICISGQFINPSKDTIERKDHSWIFESYKTAKGCDSYFEGGCSLEYKIKHGCDIVKMTRNSAGKN